MKKILIIVLFFLLSICFVEALELPIEINADSYIIVNRDIDRIIYSKNPDKEEILASLTKVMTLYTALNRIDNLNEKIIITEKDLESLWGFTQIGLAVGDKVTYRDLLYACNLTSAADAAQAIANHVSGSMEKFVIEMNKDAAKIGLNHTNFSDTIGRGDDNVSTAREFYLLLKECLKNEMFEKIFNTTYYKMSNGLESINYTKSIADFHGLDSSLITGNKSGYTPEAGLLLASTTTINNTNYIIITMKSKENQWKSTHVLENWKIYDYLTNINFKERKILSKGKLLKRVKVENGTTSEYLVTLEKDINITLSEEEYNSINIEYNIIDNIDASTKPSTNLGYVDILIGDEVIESINVYLNDRLFTRQEEIKYSLITIISIILSIIAIILINIIIIKRKHKG